MSHPKSVKLFKPWAHAMVEGATVGKPDYGKTKSQSSQTHRKKRKRRRRRRRKNAQKET